ncbi:MAG: hypothetical protein HY909_19060 [Deltaproteobacteria bacterium]|nr:hypothetical protein [Deltaproteobacteria bacterium]
MGDDIAQTARERAKRCVEEVHRALGLTLDYEPETLPVLDHHLRQAREEPDPVLTLLAATAGAYFGELLRRRYDGRWVGHQDPEGWTLTFDLAGLSVRPVAMARSAIQCTESALTGPDLVLPPSRRALVQGVLTGLGCVDREDYYRLSTRYEVLSAVFERLAPPPPPDAN